MRRQRPRCVYERESGERCKNGRLTPDGVQKLIDANVALVADPEQFCSYHARAEGARRRMQQAGGANSRNKPKRPAPDPPEMRDDVRISVYTLVRSLLAAKLPVFPVETDARKAVVGAYVAAHIFKPPDDIGTFVRSLMPRDVHRRTDLVELAEQELQDMIQELDPKERDQVWELLGTH